VQNPQLAVGCGDFVDVVDVDDGEESLEEDVEESLEEEDESLDEDEESLDELDDAAGSEDACLPRLSLR
jgi:hypothetical protein